LEESQDLPGTYRVRDGGHVGAGCQDCGRTNDLAGAAPGYRRALVVVIILNLGMGLVEVTGGLLGASQALKADALDFFGDGSITLLGFLALSWRPDRRARAALLQSAFLALLGIGVIGAAAYRFFISKTPEPGVMTGLGVAALATNLAAAAILLPHRHGDANARAVWLFSRNDAVGNLVVIAAGALVFWTGHAWPDLAAAIGIAALFLGSSRTILSEALRELRSTPSGIGPGRPSTETTTPAHR
jgi:cation diffusion facilitator family transporter